MTTVLDYILIDLQEPWRLKARCRGKDPHDFVPPFGDGKGEGGIQQADATKTRLARAYLICLHCPVKIECEDYRARTNTKDGVWGGVYHFGPRQARSSARRSLKLKLEMLEQERTRSVDP